MATRRASLWAIPAVGWRRWRGGVHAHRDALLRAGRGLDGAVLGDPAGGVVQDDRAAHLPDVADPPLRADRLERPQIVTRFWLLSALGAGAAPGALRRPVPALRESNRLTSAAGRHGDAGGVWHPLHLRCSSSAPGRPDIPHDAVLPEVQLLRAHRRPVAAGGDTLPHWKLDRIAVASMALAIPLPLAVLFLGHESTARAARWAMACSASAVGLLLALILPGPVDDGQPEARASSYRGFLFLAGVLSVTVSSSSAAGSGHGAGDQAPHDMFSWAGAR